MKAHFLAATALGLSGLCLAAPALAQSGQPGPERPVEQAGADETGAAPVIVVIGEGLPDTPSVTAYASREISREQLVTAPSGRIEEVLGAVAGFQQFRRSDSRSSNPSAQGVTLRALGGNATSRALVLLDGVPVSDPFFGYVPFTALAPERLKSIRVTRGGGAGPFGAGALAGTIELESAGVETLPPLGASVAVNDRGGTEASALLAQELGAGFVTVGGRWDRGPGFFTTPADQRVPASARAAYESWSLALRGVAPLSDTLELQAAGLVFDDQRTLRFEGADSSASGADASLRLVGRGPWALDALAYVHTRNFTNLVISSTRFTRVLDQRNTPTTGIGGKLELRPPVGGGNVLRIGTDYRRAEGELQEDAYSAFSGALTEARRAGGSTSDIGLFIESDWTSGPLVLTGGLRLDRTQIGEGFYIARNAARALVTEELTPTRADWTLSWRAGATYALDEQLRLRAAAYRGLRLPTLNELLRPFVVFPVVTQANAALENEILEGFEVGFDWSPVAGVELALTAFDNRVKGAIANVTLAPNVRQRQNLPAIEAQGIEAGLRVERGGLSFDGTLAYTDAQVVGSGATLALDGNRPSQTPSWAAAATLAYEPAADWLVSTTLRHVGAQFESDVETDRLPPATTLGAYLQAPLAGGFALVLRGENLLDERIVTRNSGGDVDLGTPRTLWAGLRYGF
ncbi:TonB-dependent receptor [Qipengyuania sp. SM2507]